MNAVTSFNLHDFFPYRARMFYWASSQAIKDIYATKYDLTVNEWRTLANLYDFPELSAKEIVEKASIGKVDVSRAVTSLQKKKLLQRHIDPMDRRRVVLSLTSSGKKLMNELLPLLLKREQEILSVLDEKEYQTLITLMRKVESNAIQFL